MRALLFFLFLLLSPHAFAGTYPVDDSASTVLSPSVNMKWDQGAPLPGTRATVSGRLVVIVRLQVGEWRGHMGKIYMKLPSQAIGRTQVSWTSRGRLLPGLLRDGERALIYAGPISDSMLEDTISLTIQTDGNRLSKPEQLQFSFEIDTQP